MSIDPRAVLSAGRTTLAVRLTGGCSLKIPRRWTDADGSACTELSGDSPFTLHGLRELLTLFMALRARDYSVAKDKFESGTGWPSFTQPLDDEFVVTQRDFKLLS